MSDKPLNQPLGDAYSPPASPSSVQGLVGSEPAATGQAPYQSPAAQQVWPPPPPPDQVWPPPPGGVQAPMPIFQTPTNAVLILALGIASIPIAMLCGVGGLIGILPWIMGNASLKAIDQGLANPIERGSVNGGRVCGIIGTVLAALMLVFGGLMFAYGLYSDHHGR